MRPQELITRPRHFKLRQPLDVRAESAQNARMASNTTRTIGIRMANGEWARLEAEAAAEGITVTDMVRRILASTTKGAARTAPAKPQTLEV